MHTPDWLELTHWRGGVSVRARILRADVEQLTGRDLDSEAFADWIMSRSNALIDAAVGKANGGSTWLVELGREDLAGASETR